MDITKVLVGLGDAIATVEATEAAKQVQTPEFPAKFNRTQRVIAHMMRENTGASILDSGGAYGRSWQRNLSKPFWDEKPCTVKFSARECTYGRDAGKIKLETDITVSLFHFLSEKLTYDRAMTRQFRKFSALEENEHMCDLELAESFPAWISDKLDENIGEVYTDNSYNRDNYLSQTIQYVQFHMNCQDYIILQIHGGCDVRGGYTSPVVFTLDNAGDFDYYRATIGPNWGEVEETKDAVKRFLGYAPMLFPEIKVDMIAEVEMLEEDVQWDMGSWEDNGEGCKPLNSYPVLKIATREDWKKGTVGVLPDGNAMCPETGALLEAWLY